MKTRILIALALLSFVFSCAEKRAESAADYSEKALATADSTAPTEAYMGSSASQNNPNDKRQFVRTADLKFKVADARTSTYVIEDIIGKNGGFVTSTQLRAENAWTREIIISEDSAVSLTTFSLVNDMEFRVPVSQLDSTLRQIGRQAVFVDYRTITADDVTQQLLLQQRSQKRLNKQNKRMEAHQEKRSGDILEATDAEQRLIDQENQLDNLQYHHNVLKDEVAYSTVHLYFYQKETVTKEYNAIPDNIEPYQEGFFSQAGERLASGWAIGKAILLFILNSWFIIVMAVGMWLGFKTFIQKKK